MTRGSVPFLWLCGPVGVGKSVVGYEIFSKVCWSGIKAAFVDFDQVGLCYLFAGKIDTHKQRAIRR